MRKKLSKVVKDLNVGVQTITDFLQKKNIEVDTSPNARVDEETYNLLVKEFKPDMEQKLKSENFTADRQKEKAKIAAVNAAKEEKKVEEIKIDIELRGPKVIDKIDLSQAGKPAPKRKPAPKSEKAQPKAEPKQAQPKDKPVASPSKIEEKAETPKAIPQAEAQK